MTKRTRLKIDSSLLYTHSGEVRADDVIQGATIGAESVIDGSGIVIEASILARTIIAGAPGFQVRRCRMETIDAANVDFDSSGWNGSEIEGSRFTGARMNTAHISSCVFRECRMNLVQCQRSRLQGVRFEKCDLRGAYFNMSQLAGTVFTGSDLTGADFSGANIEGCDFRRATIEDMRVSPEQMRAVIVTADQALYLARLFGLDVRE